MATEERERKRRITDPVLVDLADVFEDGQAAEAIAVRLPGATSLRAGKAYGIFPLLHGHGAHGTVPSLNAARVLKVLAITRSPRFLGRALVGSGGSTRTLTTAEIISTYDHHTMEH